MNKLVLAACSLLVAVSAFAGDTQFSVTSGYNNYYNVNGVSRAEGSAFVGVDVLKETQYVDVYVKGTLLPNGGLDQSHWTFGLNKSVISFGDVATLDVSGDVTRHQSGVVGIPNSTEFGAKVQLTNNLVTPYARVAYDNELDQFGWFAGVYRAQALPFGFYITPAVEYGESTDYKVIEGKVTLARPFTDIKPFESVTPFVQVSYIDNNFDTTTFNFATTDFDGDVTVVAGVNVAF